MTNVEGGNSNPLNKIITTPITYLVLGLMTALILVFILNSVIEYKNNIRYISSFNNNSSYTTATINSRVKATFSNETGSEPLESNRIIVKFKDGAELPRGLEIATERANLEKAQGLNRILTINGINAEVYEVSGDDTASEAIDRILATKKDIIEYAEVDMKLAPSYTPNDYWGSDTNLVQWEIGAIDATTAWDVTQGQGVTIAILDSGVEATHVDLADNMLPGWNFYSNNDNTSPVYFHGTVVAGVAGGVMDNGQGMVATAGHGKIMPIVVTDSYGSGYISMIAQGIVYAIDHGARVANISFLGVNNYSASRDAAQYMKNKGGLVFTAGGNTGKEESYTVTDTMISVSATGPISNSSGTYDETIASLSSYGNYIDLAAPGKSLYTTDLGNKFGFYGGTSLASPIASAVAALVMSVNPNLTSTEVESIIFNTVDDYGDVGWDVHYGHGRVNAAKAVASAVAMKAVEDTEAPTSPANLIATGTVDVATNLRWSPSTDNVLVVGYNVYRNGLKVATVSGTNYTDKALGANTTYTYSVSAFDKAGNESIKSEILSVTTADVLLAINSYSVSTKTSTGATIVVSLNKIGTVAIKYGTVSSNLNLSVDSGSVNTNHSINLTSLNSNTTYYYQVVATDSTGTKVTSPVTSFKTSRGGPSKKR